MLLRIGNNIPKFERVAYTAQKPVMKATFQTFKSSDDPMKIPVLGLYAANSRIGGDPDYMKKVYPTLNYIEIPDPGHFLMLEKPDEFNRLLLDFLKKQE